MLCALCQFCENYLTGYLVTPVLPYFNLEDYSELHELLFTTYSQRPSVGELFLINSITSTNMRKIVFALHPTEGGWNPRLWGSLDTALSGLVDRLHASGYEHTLELEFQLVSAFAKMDPEAYLDAFFPCFREKGRVTVLEKTSRRIIYCSDG